MDGDWPCLTGNRPEPLQPASLETRRSPREGRSLYDFPATALDVLRLFGWLVTRQGRWLTYLKAEGLNVV